MSAARSRHLPGRMPEILLHFTPQAHGIAARFPGDIRPQHRVSLPEGPGQLEPAREPQGERSQAQRIRRRMRRPTTGYPPSPQDLALPQIALRRRDGVGGANHAGST